MKRRDFLKQAGSLTAGSILPILAGAQSRPCPPPSMAVDGGTNTVTSCVSNRSALHFPSNASGSSRTSAYGVLEFANPHSNGLPAAGPSNSGWTVIRRIKSLQQTGYYAQFWWCQGDGNFVPSKFYAGFHPYPISQSNSGTSHWWEIAAEGGDFVDFNGSSAGSGSPIPVTYSQWYTQALRVEYNGGSPIMTMWTALPSVDRATMIRRTLNGGYFEQTPISPKIVIGNSPWIGHYQEERASCHHGEIKIIAKALSEPDVVAEANDMRTLATSDGKNHIWWGKTGFRSVDDLACDYGTGRSFTRNDTSSILSLGEEL